MFGCAEVLVPVKDLLALEGVETFTNCAGLTNFHILFDCHESVYANDVPCESLHLGPQAIASLDAKAFEKLCAVFKIKPAAMSKVTSVPVRHVVAGNRARKLAFRHAKNAKPIIAHCPSFSSQTMAKNTFVRENQLERAHLVSGHR
jgi:hypothetical protein